MKINESILQDIWKSGLLLSKKLTSSNGKSIKIIEPGELNTHSGPDFFNSKLQIDNTIWAGNVEIHIKSSDFIKHGHSADKNYNNLILHVVYELDKKSENDNFGQIATLELKNYISKSTLSNYWATHTKVHTLPCSNQIKHVHQQITKHWLDELYNQRLNEKVNLVKQELNNHKYNWEQAFWIFLSKYMGAPVNSIPFEMLARTLSHSLILHNHHNLLKLEALLLGQAGFLNDTLFDTYLLKLQKEYHFLKQKYSLTPNSSAVFKFMRLRPASFPIYRIALLSALLHKNQHCFNSLMEADSVEQLYEILNAEASEFWQSRYSIHQKNKLKITKETIDRIIINVLIPFMITWANEHSENRYLIKANNIIHQLKAETNYITRDFENAGLFSENAKQSQALITLKKKYCDTQSCIKCKIGQSLFINSDYIQSGKH